MQPPRPSFCRPPSGGCLAAGLLSAAILLPAAAAAFPLPLYPLGSNPGAWATQVSFRGRMSAVVMLGVTGLVWAAVEPRRAGALALEAGGGSDGPYWRSPWLPGLDCLASVSRGRRMGCCSRRPSRVNFQIISAPAAPPLLSYSVSR